MSIKVNTKPNNITVYDEVNYKHARDNEVISLVSNIKGDYRDTILDVISDSIGLNDSERELYKAITAYLKSINNSGFPNDNVVDLYYITLRCSEINNKSIITYRRAVDVLIKKGVIKYYQGYRAAMFNKEFDVVNIDSNVKYIVIEIDR